MKKFISCTLFLFAGTIFAAGFTGGDTFTSQNIHGNLSVSCMNNQGGPSFGVATCRMNYLNPGEYSYFQGPNVDADEVTLQTTWENGKKSKSKTSQYDSTTGKSKKSFNLWISTLTQRPLLDLGKNTVSYKLTKNGSIVESGEFIVNVNSAGTKYCQRYGSYISNDSNDCARASNLCDRYFRENNYCE